VEEETRYGTTFLKPGTTTSIGSTLQRHMDQKKVLKRVGLGVAAGFLAGSNIATQRASISVYHRYRKYLELRDNWHIQEGTGEEGDALSSYYTDFYHRNQCYGGCPANTTCEWGICQCAKPNHIQIWGECVERGSPADTACEQERNSTVFDELAEGKPCTETSVCQEEDINLVMKGGRFADAGRR